MPLSPSARDRFRCAGPKNAMYLVLSKKPRKTNRSRSNRYRAKLKAKNRRRLSRVYQSHRRT